MGILRGKQRGCVEANARRLLFVKDYSQYPTVRLVGNQHLCFD